MSGSVFVSVDVVGTVGVGFAVAGVSVVVDEYVATAAIAGLVYGAGVAAVGWGDMSGIVVAGVAVVENVVDGLSGPVA